MRINTLVKLFSHVGKQMMMHDATCTVRSSVFI